VDEVAMAMRSLKAISNNRPCFCSLLLKLAMEADII